MASFWLAATGAYAAQLSYSQVVDGVAVYFGMVPAELVRGHLPEHPEGVMHGGAPVGESHLTVAVFEAKTGRRITDAEVTAHITGDRGLNAQKRLDLMVIAGSATYGNYFSLPGSAHTASTCVSACRASRARCERSSPGRGRERGGPNRHIALTISNKQGNIMTITNVSQGSPADLPPALRIAQAAIQLPEVQAMLRRLSEYKLGIFMPHRHDEQTGEFQPLPDDVV